MINIEIHQVFINRKWKFLPYLLCEKMMQIDYRKTIKKDTFNGNISYLWLIYLSNGNGNSVCFRKWIIEICKLVNANISNLGCKIALTVFDPTCLTTQGRTAEDPIWVVIFVRPLKTSPPFCKNSRGIFISSKSK